VTIEGIIVGVLATAIGLAWAFYGFRAFTILLPVWGFLVGFGAGASWIQSWLGDGFLLTLTSWVAGLVVGVALAIISYFWYYAAVVLLGGALGYTLTAGALSALGLADAIAIVGGLIVAVVLAFVTIALSVPAYLVVVLSAIGGAVAAVNGVLILLGRIKLEDIDAGLGEGLLRDPVVAVIATIVVAAVGMFYQMRDIETARATIDRAAYRI
jgi:hypothetical protein